MLNLPLLGFKLGVLISDPLSQTNAKLERWCDSNLESHVQTHKIKRGLMLNLYLNMIRVVSFTTITNKRKTHIQKKFRTTKLLPSSGCWMRMVIFNLSKKIWNQNKHKKGDTKEYEKNNNRNGYLYYQPKSPCLLFGTFSVLNWNP